MTMSIVMDEIIEYCDSSNKILETKIIFNNPNYY